MIRLTEFGVSKRSVTLLLAAALFLAGIYSWNGLKQELLPDIEFPIITIVAPYPGAGASDVTDQVTKPIERAVAGVPRLDGTQSTSSNSISVVVAMFSYGTNVKEARTAIESNLSGVGLPQGVSPQVNALNINESPVIIASIAASGSSASGGAASGAEGLAEAGRIASTDVVPALLGLEGVGSVDITGGLEQRVVVKLDPAKLAAAGISVQQISGILAANNMTLPAGQLPQDGTSIPVSTTSSFTTLDQVRGLIVGVMPTAATGANPGSTAGGSAGASPGASPGASSTPGADATGSGAGAAGTPVIPVRLSDLGTVDLVAVPATGYARTNGEPSITLTISKSSGANTVDVAERVVAELRAAQARNPGLKIDTISDLSLFIKESRDGLVREGGLGAAFAIITIFLFLFSLRSTIVAAVSIPLSIFAALTLMLVAGISMNIMTLGGLAVAVGRVVDDAIVVLENIYRHRARGDDKTTAVLTGAREVASAITASTATTVAVFLPLGFVGGLVSQFFLPFALTVTFALLASLVCALTVVPVLAWFFVDRVKLDVDENGEPRHSFWVRAYTPTIRFVLRSRLTKWGVIALASVLFFGSLALLPGIPTQFINAGGEKTLTVTVSPPSGTSSEAVRERTIEAEAILDADPDVTLIESTVPGEGGSGLQTISAAFSGRAANSASIFVKLDQAVNLTAKTKELTSALDPIRADGYAVSVAESMGISGGGISIIVSSADPAAVASTTAAIMDALRRNPDLLDVKSDLAKAAPSVEVAVDPNKAIGAGLTAAQVASAVRTILVPQQVTRVQLGDGPAVDLYVAVDTSAIGSVEALAKLPVGTAARMVPLGMIADVRQVDAQGSITRISQRPASSITAKIASQNTGAVSNAVKQEIDRLKANGTIPPTVEVRLSGVTEQMNEAFGNLFLSMAIAVLLVYVMMVLAFNSLIDPFVILFSLPLATIGAFPALFLTGRPIGISALIGFLMLIGIVVTNAIVFLDLVERLRQEHGMSTHDALVEGGRTRVRPILMTAIATILALTPLGIGLNQGSIIASELATVVIGGLFSSTFLTLVVVPVVYSLVDGGKVMARRGRVRPSADAG